MAEGAKNLFAFSLEAYMKWMRDQKGKGREVPGSDRSQFADIQDVHSYAQEEANKVYGEYDQNR